MHYMAAWLSWLEHAVHTRRVVGSNPTAATKVFCPVKYPQYFSGECQTNYGPLVKWLRHRPFTAITGVRVPYGSPLKQEDASFFGLLFLLNLIWELSSAGGAPALQAGGRRFDPYSSHQGVLRKQNLLPIKSFTRVRLFSIIWSRYCYWVRKSSAFICLILLCETGGSSSNVIKYFGL